MKLHPLPSSLPLLVSVLLAVVLVPGCETLDESKYGGVNVSPSHTVLGLNRSVTLTATGGWNYTWTLSDPSAGSLNSTKGPIVTYTVRRIDDPPFTQDITVSGKVSNYASATGSTNTAMYTAVAQVVHGSPHPEVTIANPPGGNATVGGAPVRLRAAGGDGVSYTWRIANASIGSLSGSRGQEVTYRAAATPNATQTVTVSSGGRTHQITIIHIP